jgi:hypothetical protein
MRLFTGTRYHSNNSDDEDADNSGADLNYDDSECSDSDADSDDDDDDDDDVKITQMRDRDLKQPALGPLINKMLPHKLLVSKSDVYFASILPGGLSEFKPNKDSIVTSSKSDVKNLRPLQIAVIRNDLPLVRSLLDATRKLKHGKCDIVHGSDD